MSGKYPNGGYRTKSARELSMPSQAIPPPVTRIADSDYGNTATHVRQTPRLSDMLGNGKGTLTRGGSSVSVDLRGFTDYNAGQLPPGLRDKLNNAGYGTGKHNVTIDLDPRHFKVNGRGYLMRQAIKIGRTILGASRRLPKNLWKSLIEHILSQMLDHLAKTQPQQIVPASVTTNAELWAYNPRFGAPTASGSMEQMAFVERTSGPGPGLGEYVFTNAHRYPPATWGGPVHQIPDVAAVVTRADPWPSGTANLKRSIALVVGEPGLGAANAIMVAVWDVPGRREAVFQKVPFQYRAAFPALNQRLYQSTKVAGSSGATGGDNAEFPQPQKDTKITIPWLNGLLSLAYAATEAGDTIDCIYKALPRHKRYGRSYLDKMNRIYEAFDKIDWPSAVGCMAQNQITDPIYGKFFSELDEATKRANVNNFHGPVQITYEGPGQVLGINF